MSQDNLHYTYNPLTNEDKDLLLRNGYKPGELSSQEGRELLADLRDQTDQDTDGGRLSSEVPGDEQDGS